MSDSISLVALRLEVANCNSEVNYLDFTASQYSSADCNTGEHSKPSYASVTAEDGKQLTNKDSADIIRECQGSRKTTELVVESYYNEYCIETDTELEQGMPPKSTKSTRQKKDSPRAVSEGAVSPSALSTTGGDKQNVFRPVDSDEGPSPAPVKPRPKSYIEDIDGPGPAPCSSPNPDDGPAPRPNSGSMKTRSQSPASSPTIHFYYGNPMVERIEGIIHLYKDNKLTPLKGDHPRSELICMLAVPGIYSVHDLLKFTAPVNEGLEYIRIIRDGTPNQYMVLLKFRTQELGDEFFYTYNNTQYNSIEPDICHLVYVARLETQKDDDGASLPKPGFTELPCCPVCLEKMDESVEGILTILCNHAFHMSCLAQWGDTSCPVCRFIQTPEDVSDSQCMKCGSQESLWICLICGHIGCGRYVELHAYKHFQETNHMYAMQLGQSRVWDYVGDNYVHRLVQSKGDGKLVQVGEGNSQHEEKVDSLNLEYTYLLTSQLDSQRRFFEDKIKLVEENAQEKLDEIMLKNTKKFEEFDAVSSRMEELMKDKSHTDKKCSHLHNRLTKTLTELQEEKELNKSLTQNQEFWQKRVELLEGHISNLTGEKEQEIQDLREQLRDVMFYLEAQQKLSSTTEVSQTEIQEGQVVVGATASTPSPAHRKGRKKDR